MFRVGFFSYDNDNKAQQIPYSCFTFSGGELQVRLQGPDTPPNYSSYSSYADAPICIHANIFNANDILELMLLSDALRRKYPNAPLRLTMPYLPYARQDRVMVPGEALSLKVFTNLINSLNFQFVEIFDCHSDVGTALLDRVVNVHALEFVKKIATDNTVVISPDAGAMKKVSKIAEALKLPMIVASKVRDPKDGSIKGTHIEIDLNEVNGKTLLIVDDICDFGRTFIALAKAIRKTGASNPIELYVTHGIFAGGLDIFKEDIAHLYTANSFPGVDLTDLYLTVLKK